MDVKINVVGQKLYFNANTTIVSGSRNFVKFVFSFTKDWDMLTKYVQFIQGGNSYTTEVGNDDSCYLPYQIESGECLMHVYGLRAYNLIVATTSSLKFIVEKSDLMTGGSDIEFDDENIATVSEVEDYIINNTN